MKPVGPAVRTGEPLVSIGMPVYNGERYMRRALDSLLAQDHRNLELVISENGSADGTPAICREYAARDARVRVHTQPQHVSAIENFKTALELARGEYFMWAAHDDYWYPAFVRKAVDELERHPDAGVAMSAIDVVRENGELQAQYRFAGNNDVNNLSRYSTSKRIGESKLYYFIYGVFRTDLLREAMRVAPSVPLWDMIMMSQIALATRFRYVDSVLHTRLVHDAPQHVRHPDEPFTKQNAERWIDVKILLALARVLWSSSVVPPHRKLFAPALVSRWGWRLSLARIQPVIKRQLSPEMWQRLAPLRRLVVPR
jgi:glycosyltransferase involved in cell wall biosynthesis